MMEGRCCECFWSAEDDDGFKYCRCPYEASFTHHPDPFMGLVCSCFKPNKCCENYAHSGGYAVTGYLLCLGPVDVTFCEDVEQPCEFWEEAEENDGADL